MKTIIQRYVGLSKRNSPKWVDTHFTTIGAARESHPDRCYREIKIVNADPLRLPTIWEYRAINYGTEEG